MSEKNQGIMKFLEKNKSQLAAALPKHITADKMLRVVASEFRRIPKLKECTPASLINAVMQASLLGLNIGGAIDECYLIPYENKREGITNCQFQLGYKGMISLAYRSEKVLSIGANIVCENDEFDFMYGCNSYLNHRPSMGNRGNIVAVYAEAKLLGNNYIFTVLSVEDIEKAKAHSKTARFGGFWVSHYNEMAMKTAIRRLFKYMPISADIQRAVSLDEAAESGKQAGIIDAELCDIDFDVTESEGINQEKTKSDQVIDMLE